MCFQKFRHALVSVDLILHLGEAVALVLVHLVLDHSAAFLDGIHHLLRLGLGAAGIVSAS